MACACRMLSPAVSSVEPCIIHSYAILGNMLWLEFSWLNWVEAGADTQHKHHTPGAHSV